MFIEEIKKPEKSLGDKFEHFGKELSELCDEAFAILEDKKMDEKERSEFIDIVAAVKGAKAASYKLMEKYSKVTKEERKKIDKKVDAFVAGLDNTEE